MNVLILTENTNSKTVSIINKSKFLPLLCNTILSSSDLLKHHSISAIVIDKQHQKVDSLEFILNVNELNSTIPILMINSGVNSEAIKKIEHIKLKVRIITEDELFEKLNMIKNETNGNSK